MVLIRLDYERTSLKPYVDLFDKHIAAILKDERAVKTERNMNKVSLEF